MNRPVTRREFLQTAAHGTAALGLANWGLLMALAPVSAAEAKLPPGSVRFVPEIEPLVRLLEETPRDRVLEEFATRIRKGTSYREVLTALLLAGVRNIQPRPVGFKFHAVLVVNSAHLASSNSPDSDRWLPIFWALDQFKSSQARDGQEGDWTMGAVKESSLPPGHQAKSAFIEAMNQWDVAATDSAIAALSRTAGPQEIFELLVRYGARDFRDLGHKAIYTANSWRTLQNIGWQHAEPVLRSLAYAQLEHEEGNPASRDAEPDRPGRHNETLIKKLKSDWLSGKPDSGATRAFLATLRQANATEAANEAVDLLNRGVSPQSLWDAIFNGAAELLMRQPGIVALHSMTTSNAIYYAWQHTSVDETRRWLLLQAASFLTLFRDRIGPEKTGSIDDLDPLPSKDVGQDMMNDVFAEISKSRRTAAQKAFGYFQSGGNPLDFVNAARRMIYLKGTDSHDYKFSEAALEDYLHIAPEFRDRFLAASVFYLKGSEAPDNPLVQRTRQSLS